MSIHATLGATLYRAAVARIVEDYYIEGWRHQHGKVWAIGYSETLITALVSSGVVYGPETVRHRLVVGGTAGIMRNQVSKVGHEDLLGSESGLVSNGQWIDLSLSVLLDCGCVVARFLVVVFRLESKGPDWSKTAGSMTGLP
ncbi:hypothetical protein B0T13DRAFT_505868 [Neurospora crassa]|nr:hypothetical protein B0T13DRAFT_505868 [Neurospora crassa]